MYNKNFCNILVKALAELYGVKEELSKIARYVEFYFKIYAFHKCNNYYCILTINIYIIF